MSINKTEIERNLALAMSAIAIVYKELPLGAINRTDDFISMGHIVAFAQLDIVEDMRSCISMFNYQFYIDLLASGKLKAGKCAELASLAEHKLKEIIKTKQYPQIPAPPPRIEKATLDDHEMVVIGRDPNSDPDDHLTWGASAVFCDPWARTFYLVNDFMKVKAYGFKPSIVNQVDEKGNILSTTNEDYLAGCPKIFR